MFTSYTIVNALTTIRVRRRLTRPGEVLVRTGDSVESTHTVAQYVEPPDFRIVNVAQDLDVSTQKAATYMKVDRGDTVSQGDVLAKRGGLSPRSSRAPMSGRVVGKGRGRLLLEARPQIRRLSALVPGYVAEMWPGEGVMIETVGALVQGLWGNGEEAAGVLRVIVRAPRHPIRAKNINASSQGAILVGGLTLDEEAIDQAAEMQVRGMIVGSVPASLVPRLHELNFPVVATEGIGEIPMSRAIFVLLQSLDGREAAMSAVIGERWHRQRPYIVVPMPTQAAQVVDTESPLEVGQRVRILRGSHRGKSGTVAEILTRSVSLDTGTRMAGVLVDVGEGDPVPVPYQNLERLL